MDSDELFGASPGSSVLSPHSHLNEPLEAWQDFFLAVEDPSRSLIPKLRFFACNPSHSTPLTTFHISLFIAKRVIWHCQLLSCRASHLSL